MAAVAFEGFRRTFDDGIVAVAGLDLQIAEGSIYGVLEPNGSGKNTSIRTVCGRAWVGCASWTATPTGTGAGCGRGWDTCPNSPPSMCGS